MKNGCIECVGFRKLNRGFAFSRARSPSMNATPFVAANCAVSLMTSRSALWIPAGKSTENSAFRGAARIFGAAAPVPATATVPVASFAAFAASAAFAAIAAASLRRRPPP